MGRIALNNDHSSTLFNKNQSIIVETAYVLDTFWIDSPAIVYKISLQKFIFSTKSPKYYPWCYEYLYCSAKPLRLGDAYFKDIILYLYSCGAKGRWGYLQNLSGLHIILYSTDLTIHALNSFLESGVFKKILHS